MGVRRVLVSVFGGNYGSTRMFRRNGFIVTNMLKNYAKVRGKMRDFVVLAWDFDAVDKLFSPCNPQSSSCPHSLQKLYKLCINCDVGYLNLLMKIKPQTIRLWDTYMYTFLLAQ
jgi:hypothetical protein